MKITVTLPHPDQLEISDISRSLKILAQEFRRAKAAAALESYRIEPELRPVLLALDMDMWRLGAVRRVEEEPVLAFAMNRRHETSVTPARLFGSCGSLTAADVPLGWLTQCRSPASKRPPIPRTAPSPPGDVALDVESRGWPRRWEPLSIHFRP